MSGLGHRAFVSSKAERASRSSYYMGQVREYPREGIFVKSSTDWLSDITSSVWIGLGLEIRDGALQSLISI